MAATTASVVHTRAIEEVDAMATAIADGLEAEYMQLEARPFSTRWTVVSLSEMVVRFGHEDVAIVSRLRIPAGRWQLSSIAGVSERSLRNAFYDVYTTSPKRYLRLWQLHQVRRALRSTRPQDTSVTDVATLHGFYEPGRFAGEYKALFGEVPSQTLNRTRRQDASPPGAGYGRAALAAASAR